MGKYNNVTKEGGRGFTLVEALTVGGIGVGGGVGSYRDDSSFARGALGGTIGVAGVTSLAMGALNPGPDKMGLKGRLGWGAAGLALTGLGASIFTRNKKEI